MSPYSMGLIVFLAAAAIAGSLTPMVIQLAKRLGALDRPAHRKATSKRVVPTLGGVAIVLGVWGALLAASLLIPEIRAALFVETNLGYMIMAVGGVMAFIGAIDDRFSLNPRSKLIIQAMLALAVVAYGLSFERLSIPILGTLELHQLAIPLTVLWFVGVTNALNLVDGIDGLASGVALVVAGTVAVIAVMTGNVPALIIAAALAGACAGFLPYNFSPARIFLGDSGSLFLGATLAVISLASSTKAAVAGSMLIPVLLLGYPTLDTLLVMTRRLLKGKPIFTGGRDHVHHRLVARGLTHGQSSLALYGFCAIFCLMAIGVSTPYDQATMIGGLVVVILILIIGSFHLGYFSEMTPQQMRRRRHEHLAVRYRFLLARSEMELATTADSVLDVVSGVGKDFGVSRIRMQMRHSGRTSRWSIEIPQNGEGEEEATAHTAVASGNGVYGPPHAVDGPNGNGVSNGLVNGYANGNGHVRRQEDPGDGDAGLSDDRRADAAAGETRRSSDRGQESVREKLRFPESRMTARVQFAENADHPELRLEHRIYLSSTLQAAGRRLMALTQGPDASEADCVEREAVAGYRGRSLAAQVD